MERFFLIYNLWPNFMIYSSIIKARNLIFLIRVHISLSRNEKLICSGEEHLAKVPKGEEAKLLDQLGQVI